MKAAEARLFDAVCRGDQRAAIDAISEGADVAGVRVRGKSFLRFAGERRDLSMGRMLIDAGADPNETNGARQYSLLHNAVASHNYGFASFLLVLGADASPKNKSGATPLHFAARTRQSYLARKLLACGAEVDAQDNRGRTPLHLAIGKGDVEMSRLLINKGCNVDLADKHGLTPWQLAKSLGHDEIADMLNGNPSRASSNDGYAAKVAENRGRDDITRG